MSLRPPKWLPQVSWCLFAGQLVMASATATLAAQVLTLQARIGKEEFFEGEPVFVLFELGNGGADTAWIPHFGLAYGNLTAALRRSDGAVLEDQGLIADFFPGPGWRGLPLGPGESVFAVVVVQDRWGESGPSAPNVFIHHLKAGDYELQARFAAGVGFGDQGAGPAIPASPIRFRIRARTGSEEALFAEVKRIRDLAWDPGGRPRYLQALVSWVVQRAQASTSNPYLAFLLHNGLQTARAIGQRPDASTAALVAQTRVAIVESEQSDPAASYLITAIAADTPELLDTLVARLGSSLARSVGMALVRQRM